MSTDPTPLPLGGQAIVRLGQLRHQPASCRSGATHPGKGGKEDEERCGNRHEDAAITEHE
jgi:hypothetical protein